MNDAADRGIGGPPRNGRASGWLPFIGSLRLTDDAAPGKFRAHLAHSLFYRASILLMLVCSSFASAMHSLNIRAVPGAPWVAFVSPLFVALLLPGALALNGRFEYRKLPGIAACSLVFLYFSFIRYTDPALYGKIYFLSYLLSPGILFYWILREPELAETLGFCRKTFARDFIVALVVASLVAIYCFALFTGWRYPPKNFVHELLCVSGPLDLPLDLVMFMYVFVAWKRVRAIIPDTIGEHFSIIPLIMAMTGPQFIAYYMLGKVPGVIALGSFIGNSLLFSIVCELTFRKLKSPLAASMIMVTILTLLNCSGIR